MHELSVTESILNICVDYAQRSGAAKVTTVNLVIGQLSSIIDDSVQFYWDLISEGTVCEKAKLHFDRIPALMKCRQCASEFNLDQILSPCPSCGSMEVELLAGEEFYVDSIEIEREKKEEPSNES